MATTPEVLESTSGSNETGDSSRADEQKTADKGSSAADEAQYPRGLALALILTSVLMAMFLVSLVSFHLEIATFQFYPGQMGHSISCSCS